MSQNSKIQWTEDTWNPVLGCSKISPGCKHCYAINHVHRMAGNPNPKIREANEGLTVIQGGEPNWTGKVRLIPERLEIPLRKRKPTRYFVNSLSDLFHEELSYADIASVFGSMGLSSQHTFQILTKRSGRMLEWFEQGGPRKSDSPQYDMAGCAASALARRTLINMGELSEDEFTQSENHWIDRYPWLHASGPMMLWPLPNVWLGVSVESRDYLHRIDHLRRTPAAVRFLSLEPLLEDLGNIGDYLKNRCPECGRFWKRGWRDCPNGIGCNGRPSGGIDWVIVGGESGKGASPMHPEWVRSIRDQCVAAGVPFFFKQWGSAVPWDCTEQTRPNSFILLRDGSVGNLSHLDRDIYPNFLHRPQIMMRAPKKLAGRTLDGRTWDQMPEVHR